MGLMINMHSFSICCVAISVILACCAIINIKRENRELQIHIARLDRMIHALKDPLLVPFKRVSLEEFKKEYPSVEDEYESPEKYHH